MLTREQVQQRAAQELTAAQDAVIVEATEVSARGDLVTDAHDLVTDAHVEALPGADGAPAAPRVVAVISHTDGEGRARIVSTCRSAVHAAGVVRCIVSELAVIDVTPSGLVLREVASGVSAADVQARTEAPLLAAPDLRVIAV